MAKKRKIKSKKVNSTKKKIKITLNYYDSDRSWDWECNIGGKKSRVTLDKDVLVNSREDAIEHCEKFFKDHLPYLQPVFPK